MAYQFLHISQSSILRKKVVFSLIVFKVNKDEIRIRTDLNL